jgi:hypothetical protein
VRTVLSATHPSFRQTGASGGRAGKPRIAQPRVDPSHFNLANTPGLVVCVVSTAHAEVGVDAERLERQVDFQGLADRLFSATEARALRLVEGRTMPRRFFDYWTLKESYVKACGAGLSLPLDRFSFCFDDEDVTAVRIGALPTLAIRPRRCPSDHDGRRPHTGGVAAAARITRRRSTGGSAFCRSLDDASAGASADGSFSSAVPRLPRSS